MRKHTTRVIGEVMGKDTKVDYIGEDVEHGGYYLITDGLVKTFTGRVIGRSLVNKLKATSVV